MFCAAALAFAHPLAAQDVTITSGGGGLTLTGQVIGYDGRWLVIDSPYGPLTLDYDSVTCAGATCPDPDRFVPRVRLSGAPRMATTLMPALIEGFARTQGWQLTEIRTDHVATLTLRDADKTQGEFQLSSTSSEEGFADLTTHQTDIAMSLREVRPDERDRADLAGVGRLDSPRQSRIIALDGLVPVVSPFQTVTSLSLSDLAQAFRGDVPNWRDLGGEDQPLTLHLGAVSDGQTQVFLDRIVGANPSDQVIYHATHAEMMTAVGSDAGGLGIAGFGDVGLAQPVTLRDACGFVAVPRLNTLKAEDYPLTTPLFLYLPDRRLPQIVRDFLAFTRTPTAQLIVRRAGFVDQGAVPISLDSQGQRFVSAIAAAGSEIPLSELQRMVRVLKPRTRLSLTFRFEAGSTRLDAQSRSNLLLLARDVREGAFDGRDLMFVGFSDGRGAAEPNRDLSSARAESVRRDLLEVLGTVPSGVGVETEAFGEALPIGCDNTEWGRQMNRRVELWVSE